MPSTGIAGSIWLAVFALVVIALATWALNYVVHPAFRFVMTLLAFAIIAIVYNYVVRAVDAANLTVALVVVGAGFAYYLGWSGSEKNGV